MKICLISPPTVTDFEDPEVAERDAVRLIAEHAPLGILSLAAVLDQRDIPVHLVELNRLYYDFLRSPDAQRRPFSNFVTAHIDTLEPFDVYGFSTICSSYPLTVRLARETKQRKPEAVIVVGGPQASVVDRATLRAFDFIDFVVRGEGEETFPRLLEALPTESYHDIPGITFRRGKEIVCNPNAPVITDLDALPRPAFHLYPHLKDADYVPLELGRGCPFACEFCSTNDFFRRRFRLRSPARVLADMQHVRDEYGITHFDLVHDMFTVDRKCVVAFCEALLEAGESFRWNCSARTDCVDEDLIALMAEAGCGAIFFGIETGSARMQKIVNKKIDLEEAAAMIRCTDRNGISTAVSLITGFPDEQPDDVEATIAFIMNSLRYDCAEPQLHLLAPLAETPIQSRYKDSLVFDDIVSDMSHQGWHQDPVDREMIQAHPDIFPNFYSVPTPSLDRSYLKELREFVMSGSRCVRWLLVALHQDSGSLVRVFDAWRAWRPPIEDAELSWCYSQTCQWDAFRSFVRSEYLPASRGRVAITALLELEEALAQPVDGEGAGDGGDASPGAPAAEDFVPGPHEPMSLLTVPRLAADVRRAELSADYTQLLLRLRTRASLEDVDVDPVTVMGRDVGEGKTRLIQLSPLSAKLMALCDGISTVAQIAEDFDLLDEALDGVTALQASIVGLELLRQQGVLVATLARRA